MPGTIPTVEIVIALPAIAMPHDSERIVAAFASIEKVRLVNSGTEAVMTAIRLARAFTGRDMIVKMIGCYHGHTDALLVSAGSGAATFGTPNSAGVPGAVPLRPRRAT